MDRAETHPEGADDSPYQREEPDPADAGPFETFPRSTVVANLMRRALQGLPFETLLDETCQATAEVLDLEYVEVFQLRPEHGDLILRAGVGWPQDYIDRRTMTVRPDSQSGYTLRSWEPTVVRDIREEDRFIPSKMLQDVKIVSGVTVVIPAPLEPWGIFGAHSKEPRAFDELDTTFVQSMGQILSESIAAERLTEDDRYKKRLEQFAYAASHDLREPLRMVTSYLGLIEDRYGEVLDEPGLEFFAHATGGAHRMNDMVEGLLRFAKVTTEGDPPGPIDTDALVANVLADLKGQIEDTDAEITVEALPAVEADPAQLRQVFQNLISNALKYSGDEPPRIHISAERGEGGVGGGLWRFAVADEGVGIAPEQVPKVFDLFRRFENEQVKVEPGLGIGLTISEQIITRHGGKIWLESELGEGSTFYFTLPAADEDQASESTAADQS